VLAGSGLLSTAEDAAAAATKIGYPVLLKATGGGGGRGIFICRNADEVLSQFSISQKQGEQFFGNSGVSLAGDLVFGWVVVGAQQRVQAWK
jgi:urea carboxylase